MALHLEHYIKIQSEASTRVLTELTRVLQKLEKVEDRLSRIESTLAKHLLRPSPNPTGK